jgi:hypothetical protein
MTRSTRTLVRCLICGSSEVRTDEVIDRGVVLLGECRRCDHRWTQRLASAADGERSRLPGVVSAAGLRVAPGGLSAA